MASGATNLGPRYMIHVLMFQVISAPPVVTEISACSGTERGEEPLIMIGQRKHQMVGAALREQREPPSFAKGVNAALFVSVRCHGNANSANARRLQQMSDRRLQYSF